MRIEIQLKRVYEPPSEEDGYRILVDRLWPRGVAKAAARIDLWAKELTPSNELRQWFHAEQGREAEFAARYRAELDQRGPQIEAILASLPTTRITLVTATQDFVKGHAAVLASFLRTSVEAASPRHS